MVGQAGDARNRTVPPWVRLACGLFAFMLLSLWLMAWWLQPDPSGQGTHRQFGLPPCTFVVLWGIRCPTCGMTTSWAALADGDLIGSLSANVGGFLLAIYTAVTFVLASRIALSGRWIRRRIERIMGVALIGVAVVTVFDWLFRLT